MRDIVERALLTLIAITLAGVGLAGMVVYEAFVKY